jgi:hypothetical protein
MGAAPKVTARPLLQGTTPIAPAAVDLSIIDVHDDREAADRELWRSARKRLAAEDGAKGKA